MNLDELAQSIRDLSTDKTIHGLADLLTAWKNDQSTATELQERIERYIGNTWVEKEEEHDEMYSLWSEFRDEAILKIGGMTMNERLYWFCLFERFDSHNNDTEKNIIYKKLQAAP